MRCSVIVVVATYVHKMFAGTTSGLASMVKLMEMIDGVSSLVTTPITGCSTGVTASSKMKRA